MAPPQGKGAGAGKDSSSGFDSEPKRAPTGQIPVQTAGASKVQLPQVGGSKNGLPAVGDVPPAPAPEAKLAPGMIKKDNPFNLTQHQRQSMGSGFQDTTRERKIANILGSTPGARPSSAELPAVVNTSFTGETADPELTTRDVWRALAPKVTSAQGHRTAEVYAQVINQFGVGTNPRYEPDAPGKPRGHIFVWDVSRAMGCEIPHFVGPRELTLAQTVDWLRHEGPMRGWQRAGEYDVVQVANQGCLVVAVPKDVKTKMIAVVPPQEDDAADGKPRLTGAGKERGSMKALMDIFGVRLIEYFAHE